MGLSEFLVIVIIIAVLCALAWIPANMARRKGYSFGVFFIFGFVFFLAALVSAAMLPDKRTMTESSTLPPFVTDGAASDRLAD